MDTRLWAFPAMVAPITGLYLCLWNCELKKVLTTFRVSGFTPGAFSPGQLLHLPFVGLLFLHLCWLWYLFGCQAPAVGEECPCCPWPASTPSSILLSKLESHVALGHLVGGSVYLRGQRLSAQWNMELLQLVFFLQWLFEGTFESRFFFVNWNMSHICSFTFSNAYISSK